MHRLQIALPLLLLNLATAAAYGIKYLVYVSRFSSTVTPKASEQFASIHYFSQLIPPEGTSEVKL